MPVSAMNANFKPKRYEVYLSIQEMVFICFLLNRLQYNVPDEDAFAQEISILSDEWLRIVARDGFYDEYINPNNGNFCGGNETEYNFDGHNLPLTRVE